MRKIFTDKYNSLKHFKKPPFKFCFFVYALIYKKEFFINGYRRGAEEARRAHNPKDGGPKPPDDKNSMRNIWTQVQVSHGIFLHY